MFNFLDDEIDETENLLPLVTLEDGEVDPRYLRLSYSSLTDHHACPRYFQLAKLQKARQAIDFQASVTFAYGHAFGEGVQQYLITKSRDKAIWAAYLIWNVDYLAADEKRKKSFPEVIAALIEFFRICDAGRLDEYEVAYFDGKPAAELSFRIKLKKGYYRGYVDLVLRHKITGEYLILELKTSSATWVNHYQYKNSAQAIGYSVILDRIAPGTSAYSVFYLVQLTRLGTIEDFEFPKTAHQRALWIRNVLWDEQVIIATAASFGNYGVWPTHGESCTRFGSTCGFMDMCHLSTETMMAPLREDMLTEEAEYDFEFNIEELMQDLEVA